MVFVMDLDEGSPEELGWAGSIVTEEELGSGINKLFLGEEAIIVGVNGLEGGRGHVGVQPNDVEEDAVLIGADEAIIVGVNSGEEEGEWSLQGVLEGSISDLLLHRFDECTLVDAITSNLGEEVVPHSADLGLDDLASGGIGLLLLDKAGAHALKVLPGDAAVLVEVDPLEVGLHFADPEVRHDC